MLKTTIRRLTPIKPERSIGKRHRTGSCFLKPSAIRIAELGAAQAFDLAGAGDGAFDQPAIERKSLTVAKRLMSPISLIVIPRGVLSHSPPDFAQMLSKNPKSLDGSIKITAHNSGWPSQFRFRGLRHRSGLCEKL